MPIFAYAKAAHVLLAVAETFTPVVVTPTGIWEVEDGAPGTLAVLGRASLVREVRRVQGAEVKTFTAAIEPGYCGKSPAELVLVPKGGGSPIRTTFNTDDGSIAAAIAGKLCRSTKP